MTTLGGNGEISTPCSSFLVVVQVIRWIPQIHHYLRFAQHWNTTGEQAKVLQALQDSMNQIAELQLHEEDAESLVAALVKTGLDVNKSDAMSLFRILFFVDR
jgi:hypothetical protein